MNRQTNNSAVYLDQPQFRVRCISLNEQEYSVPRFLLLLTAIAGGLLCASVSRAGSPAHSLSIGDGFSNPLGYHDATPRFSWKLPLGVVKQTGYRLEVRSDGRVVWDSDWVDSDQSVRVAYQGDSLRSRQRLTWRVDYRDELGNASGWSEPGTVELGLLSNNDWQASWIRVNERRKPEEERVAWLRRGFRLDHGVRRARLHVTALGVFEMSINGKRVGTDAFAPGWTSYENRVHSLTYDVTDHLVKGENAIGAILGTGWYAGRLGWKHDANRVGRSPMLLVQLEIESEDGNTTAVLSNGEWKATLNGPIRSASIYDGETYDASLEMDGWDEPGFQDSQWDTAVQIDDLASREITPKPFEAVRVTEEVKTVAITQPTPGHYVFDLGQNLVGWVDLRMPGVAGETVTIRFAEMLQPDGNIYTENYRSAKSTDRYTASRTGDFRWRPTFTFHGFRYVELTDVPSNADPTPDWVTALVLHSDLAQAGAFVTSHSKLNRLQKNISWGQRGNFLDIPTDCPQRDERLGWTGDAQAFCSTAMFNYDSHAFWKNWLGTMRDEQLDDGRIPHVIPDILHGGSGSPGWMDAATIVPWEVYLRTGDREVLVENYEMMERLVGWYRSQSEDGLIPKIGGFGDWLQPNTDNTRGDTPKPLLGSAFYARSATILSETALVLGNSSDAERYEAEADRVRAAFAKHYFDDAGRLQNAPETQTAYVLALKFGLAPPGLESQVADHLVRLISQADGHLRTGFLGTPYLAEVLDRAGHPGISYSLLFKETYPSWFFSINQGATTMWERWDSYTHEHGFNPKKMNSFNHYAYGAIGEWMYERVAGLAVDPANPGYKHFFIRPAIGGPLTSARAELETVYGKAVSGWKLDGKTLTLDVVVPPNTTATIEFPNGEENATVAAGKHAFTIEMQ